jgi:two-component system response regulator DesR
MDVLGARFETSGTGANVIRVLFVHDTWLMRSALTALLSDEEDIEVTAAPWTKAPGRARAFRPQVCIVDGDVPGTTEFPNGPGGPGCALLVLATACRPGVLRRALAARALGIVDKDTPPVRLLRAIRLVAAGQRYVDGTLAADFLQATEMPLTARELAVLTLARELHLSNGTVRNYMAAINRKTGARNRVDAIRISQGAGWL